MNEKIGTAELMNRAFEKGTAIPAFNIPYLPMMKPVIDALRDAGVMGLVMVARLEWVKFESGSMKAIRDRYEKLKDERFTRLHLDHIPVIDEDGRRVPYLDEIREAVSLGYESVMVDGSRLSLEENISATREVLEFAASRGIPVEGELGAVLGHESGPMPPYEELFRSKKGFTDPDEAVRFVGETGVNWLSIACGNIHGAISKASKDKKKLRARLDLDHIEKIAGITRVPLVLHGGTGISPEDVRNAVSRGIAKINIATAIRQPYEKNLSRGSSAAGKAVYDAAISVLVKDLKLEGSAEVLLSGK
jgi:ketose-bisphosphate aldolase